MGHFEIKERISRARTKYKKLGSLNNFREINKRLKTYYFYDDIINSRTYKRNKTQCKRFILTLKYSLKGLSQMK